MQSFCLPLSAASFRSSRSLTRLSFSRSRDLVFPFSLALFSSVHLSRSTRRGAIRRVPRRRVEIMTVPRRPPECRYPRDSGGSPALCWSVKRLVSSVCKRIKYLRLHYTPGFANHRPNSPPTVDIFDIGLRLSVGWKSRVFIRSMNHWFTWALFTKFVVSVTLIIVYIMMSIRMNRWFYMCRI